MMAIVGAALLATPLLRGAAAPVRPGLEVLLSDSLHLVRGRRVGLLTHQGGIDHTGRRGVDRLLAAGVAVRALFSPEHGFRGTADPGAPVASTIDSATGLPIYSLYGPGAQVTPAMLAGLDVVLIDMQDSGARYFTYIAAAVRMLEAAQAAHLPVVVLDRPNPIGGAVQGNVLDPAQFKSDVGFLAVPMRHGLTFAELVLLARHDLGLTAEVHVVPVAGWKRAMYFDETGLPFVAPSPNLPTLEALIHYPGLCLFEGTNLSVGRGSARPFEHLGTPGLAPAAVAARLAALQPPLPGVRFEVDSFTPVRPGDRKLADTLLTGLRFIVTDRQRYDPTRTALVVLQQFANLPFHQCLDCADADSLADAAQFTLQFIPRHFLRLAGDSAALGWAEAGADPGDRWRAQRDAYLARRRPFLIYPE